MRRGAALKLAAIGLALTAILFLALTPGAKPPSAEATANPLPPLIACPNVDASVETGGPAGTLGKVTVADILTIVHHYNKSYGQSGYEYLWDPVMPYNSTSPAGTGTITVADILYVVNRYNQTCPRLDTQIAAATRAIGDPTFSSKYCDPSYTTAVNCGGDPRFLTEDPTFLASRGYPTTSIDVPGQGVHYGRFISPDGVFNPARPEALVYKNGALVAQLYYAEGDVVGWGSDPAHNIRAVNIDALPCAPSPQEPPGTGCSWDGANDGWHWHVDICIVGIGGSNPQATRITSQSDCAAWGASLGINCTFPPATNFNCVWRAALGWMSHLWNWLPNANYTNAVQPNANGQCAASLCATGEANGRFADCFPDLNNWNAYNCPQ